MIETKKYVMLLSFTAVLSIWLLVMPMISAMSVTEVTGVVAAYNGVNSYVDCTGTVAASKEQTISFGYAVKPGKIYVKVGDTVQAGDKLMDIDQADTLDAYRALASASNNNENSSAIATNESGSNSAATDSGSISDALAQYYGRSGATSSATGQTGGEDAAAPIPATAIPAAVYAGVSGVVTQINMEEEVFAQPATALIVVSDLHSVQIDAQLDESVVAKVCTGQNAAVSGDGFDKTYSAKIAQIYPAARTILTDVGKKTVVEAVLSIDHADGSLMPGLNTQVKINVSPNKKAILLPYSAVGEDKANIMYVYVVENGRAVRKNITAGSEYKDTVEITGGVQPGNTVVTVQSRISRSGIPVRLKNT